MDNFKQELKLFGLAFVVVFSLLSIKLYKAGNHYCGLLVIAAAALLLLTIFKPVALFPIFKLFKIIGNLAGLIISSLVLIIIFYFVITPIGILYRLSRRGFFAANKDSVESYWIDKKYHFSKETYKRQF